jgi:hypothetical protein
MPTRLRSGARVYVVSAWPRGDGDVVRFRDRSEAHAWVRRIAWENRTELRRALGENVISVHALDDAQVAATLADQLFAGQLTVTLEALNVGAVGLPALGDQSSEADAGEAAYAGENGGAEEEAEEKVRTWLEIVLVGEDDQPIAGERYRVELPDGSVREGRLGSDGSASFDDIDPGRCKIGFPDLDKEAWA